MGISGQFREASGEQSEPNRLGYRSLKLKQACLEDGFAGYQTTISESRLQGEIMEMLQAGGATDISIQPGIWEHPESTSKNRPAYRLQFMYEGLKRQYIQVALPIRGRQTTNKEKQVKRQALYNLRDSIRMELERRHYQPDVPAFVAYALAPGQERTIAEVFAGNEFPVAIPERVSVNDDEVIQGEFTE